MSDQVLIFAHNWNYLDLRPYHVGWWLSRRGYMVTLMVPGGETVLKYSETIVNEKFKICRSPTLLKGGLSKGCDPLDLVTKLLCAIKENFDIVVAFDSRPSVILPAIFAKCLKKVPMVVDWTDWFGRGGTINERSSKLYQVVFGKIETFFEEFFSQFADSYTVICYPLMKRLRDMGYQRNVLYFPLACRTYEKQQVDCSINRKALGLPNNVKLIAQVGTLFKGDAELLFESLAIAQKSIDILLISIGENNFENQYRIPDGIIRTGRISYDELVKYVSCCDIGVMPLRNNIANNGRWPSKLNDYLTAGVPVVSTEISVVKELFKISSFGEIARDNPIDFAEKIVEVITDRKKLEIYKKNSLYLAQNTLSWRKLIDGLDAHLQETIKMHKYNMGNKYKF